MKRRGPSRAANIWTARIIPVILFGIIGYSTWVVTKKVCIDYLLRPNPSTITHPRPGAAIAILVIYYLLLQPLLICYGRLIQTIVTNPGFTPRGAAWHTRQADADAKSKHTPRRGGRGRHSQSAREKDMASRSSAESLPSSENTPAAATDDRGHPLISDFWQKDVFACNYDGRPPFCSSCLNWKTDRAHHCSEVDRCVRKMDHFCPWVGGIISETSFKFFVQFLGYTALFCTHTLIFTAYFLAERSRHGYRLDVHWVLLVAFAALFLLFSAGMFSSGMQFAALNVTTIENFNRHQKVWYLCVYMPRPEETLRRIEASGKMVPRTIPYPRPPEENAMIMRGALGEPVTNGARGVTELPLNQRTRVFAILELPPGVNPWDCGPVSNIREVMGYSLLEWLVPLRYSPCASHNDPESMFKLGPAVEKAKREAGLIETMPEGEDLKKRKRRRRRRRSEATHAESGDETTATRYPSQSHSHSRRKSRSEDEGLR